MTKRDKILESMRRNPKGDWRIDDLKSLADYYEIIYRHHGSSHVTFRYENMNKVTVPVAQPVRPVYVKQFLEFLDGVKNEKAKQKTIH